MAGTPTTHIPSLVAELRATFDSGATRPLEFRIKQLEALHELLTKEEDALLDALHKDLKKPRQEGYMIELQPVKNGISKMLMHLEEYLEAKPVERGPAFLLDKCYTKLVPRGVVLLIGPWNYPLQLIFNPLLGAIAGGNVCCIKPSEISPHCSALVAKLVPKYLDSRAYKVVLGGVPESTRLLEQKWDLIFYTGSTAVGKIVMRAASEHLTPVLLELGGKSPVIIDDTVDPKIAAKRIVWGKLINCGQTCIAPDYVLIDKKSADAFFEACQSSIREILDGSPDKSPYYGRIISKNHFNRLTKLLQDQNLVESSRLIVGGASSEDELYIEPTIFSISKDIKENPLMEGEIFGPLLPVIPVDSTAEAIKIVRSLGDAPLALHAFTKRSEVYEKIFASINAGHALANEVIMNGAVEELPFGGVNESGLGSYHGIHSIRAFTREQGYFIRDISNDLVNYPKYPNVSGNVQSMWYKVTGRG
ncbi:Aldehyde dehydrogenase [Kappamyces sp. JEL0680]|nr:Aldehyde dehydrogenase [Kappamyces sp. JEL0680]